MASKRWDRGRRTRSGGALDIQGTLGTLLRTTLHQMGVVKDAVERQARSSLEQLDTAKLQRRRREALARLGEVVWDLAVNGELGELGERGEVAALLDEIEALEASAEEAAGPDEGTVSSAEWKPPARGQAKGRRHHETMRVWRPNLDDPASTPDSDASAGAAPDDDAPAEHAATRGRTEARSEEPAARGRGRRPARRDDDPDDRRDDRRTGGIAFMEDGPAEDDLADYMNDEDVPPRRK
jgi:hypothetical protein